VSLLEIRVFGDPVLRQETRVVEQVTDEHRRLIDDMLETMYAAKGIGLAAPQVGRLERIAVIDVHEGQPFAIVNPEIVYEEGAEKGEEGCLSIPEVYGDVERSQRVTVRALDRDGKELQVDADELLARCLQHEIDHLHGKLFLDYFSLLKRRSALAKWEKLKRDYPELRRRVMPEVIADHHEGEESL
jgi:peptide deformylase